MLVDVSMTLRPDDRALAAYLLERDLVALDELARAMHDAASSMRDLGESLVRRGILDPQGVVRFRAEVAMKAHALKKEDPTLPEMKKRSFDLEAPVHVPDEDDTWFDIPAGRMLARDKTTTAPLPG